MSLGHRILSGEREAVLTLPLTVSFHFRMPQRFTWTMGSIAILCPSWGALNLRVGVVEGKLEDTIFQQLHACSHFRCVGLFATLSTLACQAPLSMGFSRQEYWSVLHALLQGIFLTQGLNLHLLCLPHWQQVLYHQHHKCTTSHSLPDCLRLFHISAEV